VGTLFLAFGPFLHPAPPNVIEISLIGGPTCPTFAKQRCGTFSPAVKIVRPYVFFPLPRCRGQPFFFFPPCLFPSLFQIPMFFSSGSDSVLLLFPPANVGVVRCIDFLYVPFLRPNLAHFVSRGGFFCFWCSSCATFPYPSVFWIRFFAPAQLRLTFFYLRASRPSPFPFPPLSFPTSSVFLVP